MRLGSVFVFLSLPINQAWSVRAAAPAGAVGSYWLQLFNTPLIGRLSGSGEGGHFVSVAQRRNGVLGG